jgi:TPR repeat protein
LANPANAANPRAVKRFILLLGAVAFVAIVAKAADSINTSELRAKAESGDAESQRMLAIYYRLGIVFERNHVEAAKWYRKAADQGDATAQYHLGELYANGMGVIKDEGEAAKWCRKAAEQGAANAQVNLGVLYAKGEGVVKNEGEAAKWYRKAAEQGDATAQYNLGILYAIGVGVAKDQVEAYAWLNLAALKDEDGRTQRDNLEKILSREEIAAGQRRTRELQKEIESKIKTAGK